MPHTFTNLLTHVIFGTKNRVPIIGDDIGPQLHAYMGGIIRELNGKALAVNGTSDHIHLLISLPPALSLSDAMRVLKTNSSRWVKEGGREGFGW
jgi:REP element-mobilizing transposase RayT